MAANDLQTTEQILGRVKKWTQKRTVYDISANHLTNGSPTKYADLQAALGTDGKNVPVDVRHGGMEVCFVSSSDNKYMQYRLITEDFSTNEEDWQSVNEYIKESKRYVFALVDNDDKMVFGITKDGKFVCQDDFLSLALANPLSLKVNISDIVDNLTTQSVTVPLSAKQGYVLKELIDALNTTLSGEITTLDNRVSAIEANYTFITNDRYLIAIVDADEKVLWGIKKDGKLDEPTRLEESLNWLFVLTDNNGSVVFGIKKDGSVYAPGLTITNYDAEIAELQGDIENIQGDIVELQEAIENFEVPDDTVEIAIGKQRSYGTYQSELDASPFVDSAIEQNIGYKTIHKNTVLTTINKKMIVMNHDDGSLPDIIGTRKIYNKYGFKGSFCCVFTHFSTLSAAKKIITNMKKLIKEGHAVGLHAIMNASYWYANRIYDVTPDGSSNFAPLLSEIQGDNPDGTGINTFGDTITVDTLASDVYYMTPTAELIPELNVKVVDLTQSQVDRLNRQYCLYSDEYATTGIDDLALTDIMSATSANSLTKTKIQWLEYYYNGLVDNTLGYSSTASTIAQKFAEDYNVPSGANAIDYYPDASHLKSGKMVYWNDTTNSHYADAKVKTASGFSEDDYQFVGKFTKGLYKDCFSTMNFEVMDRCVAIAEAFFRKYHGLNHFAEFHIHGIHYLNWYYQNTDGSIYSDREKEMIYYPLAKWYSSRKKAFVSVADIMSEYGMNFVKDGLRREFVTWFGSEGFYYKADGVRNVTDDFNNNFEDYYASSTTQYLAAFGTTDTGMSTMSYTTFNTFMQGVDNWLKYFYDNAGATNVSRNGISGINIYSYLKNDLEKILGSVGSGRVPVISVDTIANSPGVLVAVEVLFRFLKAVGFEVVSLEEGRQRVLSVGRDSSGNLFPNPSFERTLLDYFGGSSTQKDAYKPDGWMGNSWGNVTYDVTKGTVGENQNVPILSINGGTWLYTSAWGLPAGSYKLSFWAKGSNAVSILTGLIKNRTNIKNAFDSTKEDNCIIDTYNPASTSEWSEHVVNITIPDFHRNTIDADDFYNVVCDGYEDNVCAIALRINVSNNSYMLDFSCPKLYKINN